MQHKRLLLTYLLLTQLTTSTCVFWQGKERVTGQLRNSRKEKRFGSKRTPSSKVIKQQPSLWNTIGSRTGHQRRRKRCLVETHEYHRQRQLRNSLTKRRSLMHSGSLGSVSPTSLKIGWWAAETVTHHVNSARVKCLAALSAKLANLDASLWLTVSVVVLMDPSPKMVQTVAALTATLVLQIIRATSAARASLKLAANVSVSVQ